MLTVILNPMITLQLVSPFILLLSWLDGSRKAPKISFNEVAVKKRDQGEARWTGMQVLVRYQN
jgi:hypothetical protein